MNYRHAFHAGNFADVVKHAVLVRILVHLRAKPAAFRVIDTHAGAGVYDLAGAEASRSGEWRAGIRPAAHRSRSRKTRVRCWRHISMRSRPSTAPSASPSIPARRRWCAPCCARRTGSSPASWSRTRRRRSPPSTRRPPQQGDRDRRLDRAQCLVPPKERRGLVLVDPPFEDAGDFPRLAHALEAAQPQMGERHLSRVVSDQGAGGARCLGAPLAALRPDEGAARRAQPVPLARSSRHRPALDACGLIVINPPWTLAGELAVLLPALAGASCRARRRRPPRRFARGRFVVRHFSTALDWPIAIGLALTFRLLWGPAE